MTRYFVKGIVQEFTQLDMTAASKNEFMTIIIEFFTAQLAKDNKTIATPQNRNSIDEVTKDFYLEQDGTANDTEALSSESED